MTLLNIPDDFILYSDEDKITYKFNLTIFTGKDKVKFGVNDTVTSWLSLDDKFIDRIQFDNLNVCLFEKHLTKEIEIKNFLDEAVNHIKKEKYPKAIKLLDDVILYDSYYGDAYFYKSKALFSQGHFVKSLRNYKKAIKADSSLRDNEYYKLLLKKSSAERDNFPRIKQNIYAGDEYFAQGKFKSALESYDKALVNPSKFKEKILYRLLNKKATTLLKLHECVKAYECFTKSIEVMPNDYAYFGVADSLYENQKDQFCKCCLNRFYLKNIIESLENAKILNKNQLFKKALILNELEEFELALDAIDEFFNVYYFADEDYLKALLLKQDILISLDEDTSEVEDIISKIWG